MFLYLVRHAFRQLVREPAFTVAACSPSPSVSVRTLRYSRWSKRCSFGRCRTRALTTS